MYLEVVRLNSRSWRDAAPTADTLKKTEDSGKACYGIREQVMQKAEFHVVARLSKLAQNTVESSNALFPNIISAIRLQHQLASPFSFSPTVNRQQQIHITLDRLRYFFIESVFALSEDQYPLLGAWVQSVIMALLRSQESVEVTFNLPP